MKNVLTTYSKYGVTLVELAVILAILILIAGIGTGSYNYFFRERAIRENALSAIREIANSVEMYAAEFTTYQPTGELIEKKLSIYTDVTRLTKHFLNTKGKDPIYNNLTLPLYIIKDGEALCVYGAVGKIKPGPNYDYWIIYCIDTDETKEWAKQKNQPACYWEPYHTWQPCSKGL